MKLEPGKNYKTIIVKEEYGHMCYIDFSDTPEGFVQMKKNLEKAGAQIVNELIADKDELKKIILALNKEANLPGVKFQPIAA